MHWSWKLLRVIVKLLINILTSFASFSSLGTQEAPCGTFEAWPGDLCWTRTHFGVGIKIYNSCSSNDPHAQVGCICLFQPLVQFFVALRITWYFNFSMDFPAPVHVPVEDIFDVICRVLHMTPRPLVNTQCASLSFAIKVVCNAQSSWCFQLAKPTRERVLLAAVLATLHTHGLKILSPVIIR